MRRLYSCFRQPLPEQLGNDCIKYLVRRACRIGERMHLVGTEDLEVWYLATFIRQPFGIVGFVDSIYGVEIVFGMRLISVWNIYILPHIKDWQFIMPT